MGGYESGTRVKTLSGWGKIDFLHCGFARVLLDEENPQTNSLSSVVGLDDLLLPCGSVQTRDGWTGTLLQRRTAPGEFAYSVE